MLDGFDIHANHNHPHFKSGHCLKDDSRIILLNKVAPIESKVNFLCDVLRTITVDESLLTADDRKLIEHLKQTELKL